MRTEIRPVRLAGSAVAVIVTALALSACQAEKKVATQGTAGGEVLPGSASDAMLPVDSLRSQPPLAPKIAASAKAASIGGKSAALVSDNTPADEVPAEAPPADAPSPGAPAAQ